MARLDYLLTQFTVIVRYLGLLVLPVGQTVDHDVALRTSLADPAVLASAAVLLALAGAAAGLLLAASPRRARPARPGRRASPRWGSPGSSSRSRSSRASSPSWTSCTSTGSTCPSPGSPSRWPRSWPWARAASPPAGPRRSPPPLGLLLAAVLGGVTWRRNEAWSSEVALWTDAVEKAPAKARPRHNLGVALNALGRRAEAMALLQEAVRLDPGYAQGHESLGVALGDAGRPAEAEVHFRRAIELDPKARRALVRPGDPALRRPGGTPRPSRSSSRPSRAARTTPTPTPTWAPAGTASGAPPTRCGCSQGARDVIRDTALARAQLALGLAQLGDLAAARREADAIRRLSPGIAAQVQGYIDSRGRPPR